MVFSLLFLLVLQQSFAASTESMDGQKKTAKKSYEQLLAERVVNGKVEWLHIGSKKVLVIYQRAVTPQVAGAVIIVPGEFDNANSHSVVAPLRNQMPEMGWSAISISPPAPPKLKDKKNSIRGMSTNSDLKNIEANYTKTQETMFARIRSAIDFLKGKGYRNILLIGHGTGAMWSALFLMQNKDEKQVKGLVLISAYAPDGMPQVEKTNRNVPKLPMPVLDLYGSDSSHRVLSQIRYRMVESRRLTRDQYWARLIHGANYNYYHDMPVVIKSIRAWLLRNESGFKMERNQLKPNEE